MTDFKIITLEDAMRANLYRDEFANIFMWAEGSRWYAKQGATDGKIALYREGPRNLRKCMKVKIQWRQGHGPRIQSGLH